MMAARTDDLSNWHVIGHDWAVRALARSIATDRIAHAYLFTGPHATGKTTLARALAQALECTSINRPCGECATCQRIAQNRHPDVQLVEGVPPRFDFDKDAIPLARTNDWEHRTLRIKQIRDIEHFVSRSPFEGHWKIVILRRFEEAEDPAANAFLKTLEEPPSHTRLILTARDTSLLLPTIASRCQVFALRPLALAEVESALIQRWQVEPEQARLLAHLSGGRLGWAVRASADHALLDVRRRHLDMLNIVLGEGRAERLGRAGDLAKETDTLPELLEQWIGWWRDVLIVQNGDRERVSNVDCEKDLYDHAARFGLEDIQDVLKSLRATTRYLAQNVNARLAMEVLLLNLPGIT